MFRFGSASKVGIPRSRRAYSAVVSTAVGVAAIAVAATSMPAAGAATPGPDKVLAAQAIPAHATTTTKTPSKTPTTTKTKTATPTPSSSGTGTPGPTTSPTPPPTTPPPTTNPSPIIPANASPTWIENQNPGSTAWQIPTPGHRVGDDRALQLEAYADLNSVQHGQTINFHVTTAPAQNVSTQVFRMGYYGGTGARLMTTSPQFSVGPQTPCPLDVPTGLIECHWNTAWSLTVPSDWLSGMYLAVFTNASGYQWADPFTVTEPTRASAIIVVDPVNTYEAYNQWPNDQVYGKNLYDGFGPLTVAGTAQAVKVSFDRPYQQEGGAGERDRGPNWAARWLEQQGYDVTYATSTDMQNGTLNLGQYKVYISPSHDEYWSQQMYDRVTAAQQAGVSLAFLSANSIYWQTRSEPSTDGRADRVVVCYKGAAADPVQGANRTVLWRNAGRPEQQLLGAMYNYTALGPDAPWVASGAGGPAFPGAQVGRGTSIKNLVGVEADQIVGGFPGPAASQFYVLSDSAFLPRGVTKGATLTQQSTLYKSSQSAAWVFDAGTFNWAKGLSDSVRGYADGRVATIMANILGVMLGQANPATITRVAGQDRMATAAAISRYAFPNGATSVYIANGSAFADALTGAPAAGRDKAPTLLVDTGDIPAPTVAELQRIAPQNIYVLGGSAVVSDSVVAQLVKFTHGGSVQRLAGSDRFATAVMVSQHAFQPGVPVVYVAAGTGFPDAMAAGAAGAHEGAPVLLTDPGALTPATAAEISRLHPAKIVILGGVKAVTPVVQDQLGTYAPVTRAAGPDRVQTAVALASMTQAQGSVDTVFIANGVTLADGLTGGAAAGLVGAPMLTTDSSGLDPWSASELRILNPKHIVILGGPNAVTAGALATMHQLFTAGSTYQSFAAAIGATQLPVTGTGTPAPTTPGAPGTSGSSTGTATASTTSASGSTSGASSTVTTPGSGTPTGRPSTPLPSGSTSAVSGG